MYENELVHLVEEIDLLKAQRNSRVKGSDAYNRLSYKLSKYEHQLGLLREVIHTHKYNQTVTEIGKLVGGTNEPE